MSAAQYTPQSWPLQTAGEDGRGQPLGRWAGRLLSVQTATLSAPQKLAPWGGAVLLQMWVASEVVPPQPGALCWRPDMGTPPPRHYTRMNMRPGGGHLEGVVGEAEGDGDAGVRRVAAAGGAPVDDAV